MFFGSLTTVHDRRMIAIVSASHWLASFPFPDRSALSHLQRVSTLSSLVPTPNPSTKVAPSNVTRKVTLKTIPKKVKGNEESVWSEMRVLQCVSFPHPLFSTMCLCA